MFIRTVILFAVIFGIALAVHSRLADREAVFPETVAATQDAAAAMRAITDGAPVNKPWIVDFNAFCANHPGQWVVGRCAKPCLSEAEAQQAARSDAARQVYSIVLEKLGRGDGGAPWLAARVLADVRSGQLASDALVEKFARPYGTVWTDTVLLDASPAKLDAMVDGYRSELRMRQVRMAGVRILALGSVLSAWVIYLLINMVTKGYFTLRLRLVAGTITAVALLLFLG